MFKFFNCSNLFLTLQEKSNLKKEQEEAQEAANKDKGKVIVTFDLVGRKVIICSCCTTANVDLFKLLSVTI